MAMDVIQRDPAGGTGAKVDTDGNAIVTFAGYSKTGVTVGGGPAAGPATFMENDPGTVTGARYVRSPEVDEDYRLRVAHDHVMDKETFNYTNQNTGKHSHTFTTLTATVSANGLLTNSGSGVATATGMTFGTFAEFPCAHAAASTYCETNMALNVNVASIPSNAVIDVGLFRRGASTAFAPTDGVYFRFSSAGITGVINNNGVETTTAFGDPLTFLANENHLYTITITEKEAEFWVDGVRFGGIDVPLANAQLFRSASLPWSVRHANTGAVGAVLQATISDYTVSYGGPLVTASLAQIGNRSLGSYQGLSGGTMGSLVANMTNSLAFPTTAAGSNTAANSTGLGGVGNVTAAAAAATDFILNSYQVPAGTTAVQGRRLVITGVRVSAVNLGAAVATTATTLLIGLAFGHTAVSLATNESASFTTATTKAPRRMPLGFMYWNTAAPIGATPQNGDIVQTFANPIYVNPGEFIATTAKFVTGTATASQSIGYTVTFDYGWE